MLITEPYVHNEMVVLLDSTCGRLLATVHTQAGTPILIGDASLVRLVLDVPHPLERSDVSMSSTSQSA